MTVSPRFDHRWILREWSAVGRSWRKPEAIDQDPASATQTCRGHYHRSALGSGAAGDRPHDRSERLGDLQLLVRPVGGEGGQQAVAIALNAEHGAKEETLLLSLIRPSPARRMKATKASIEWHKLGDHWQGWTAVPPQLGVGRSSWLCPSRSPLSIPPRPGTAWGKPNRPGGSCLPLRPCRSSWGCRAWCGWA